VLKAIEITEPAWLAPRRLLHARNLASKDAERRALVRLVKAAGDPVQLIGALREWPGAPSRPRAGRSRLARR
jgi:hypothetical protein